MSNGGFFSSIWSYFGDDGGNGNTSTPQGGNSETQKPKTNELVWNEKYNRYIPTGVDPEKYIKELEEAEKVEPPPMDQLSWGNGKEQQSGEQESGVLHTDLYVQAFNTGEKTNVNEQVQQEQQEEVNQSPQQEVVSEPEQQYQPFFVPSGSGEGETYSAPESADVRINTSMPVKINTKEK